MRAALAAGRNRSLWLVLGGVYVGGGYAGGLATALTFGLRAARTALDRVAQPKPGVPHPPPELGSLRMFTITKPLDLPAGVLRASEAGRAYAD
jgi:hypothetical protein